MDDNADSPQPGEPTKSEPAEAPETEPTADSPQPNQPTKSEPAEAPATEPAHADSSPSAAAPAGGSGDSEDIAASSRLKAELKDESAAEATAESTAELDGQDTGKSAPETTKAAEVSAGDNQVVSAGLQTDSEQSAPTSPKSPALKSPEPKSTPRAWAEVTIFCTSMYGERRLKNVARLKLQNLFSSALGGQSPTIFVEPDCTVGHPWLGFGGSFTEAAAETFKKLSKRKQDDLINSYFSRISGLGYTLGRVPIGSCDFSLGFWTCGDMKCENGELKGFSIEKYRHAILPLIKRAAQVSGKPITMLASPWSPVPFMKVEQKFNGSSLKPEYRGPWAQHYVRFVEEMKKEGVPIWAVSVQNEPEAEQPWESCVWTAPEERDFVREFLGPALQKAGLEHVKVIVWDHNRDGMLERAATVYKDPEAAKYVWGVAYHWYGDARFEVWPEFAPVNYTMPKGEVVQDVRAQAGFDNVRRVAELRPDKHILFTEGCQELSGQILDRSGQLGNWKLGERYAMNIISDINAGTEGWIDWNLCLDEKGGPNHVGNYCVAPVIVDTRHDTVKYQPCFWYLSQFSRFIRPGARRVVCGCSRDVLEVTAFLNPPDADDWQDTVAVVVLNQSDVEVAFFFKVCGCGASKWQAPAHSIQTFMISREKEGKSQKPPGKSSGAEEETKGDKDDTGEKPTSSASERRERGKEKRIAAKLILSQTKKYDPDGASGDRLWLVVGGGNSSGGILVRRGETMSSPVYSTRLATGALIQEIEMKGNRIHYKKIAGEGPDIGWVSVSTNESNLIEPFDSDDEWWGA